MRHWKNEFREDRKTISKMYRLLDNYRKSVNLCCVLLYVYSSSSFLYSKWLNEIVTFLWHINKYHRLRRLQMFIIIQYTDIKVCCRYNAFTNKIWMYRKIEMHMTSAYPILLLTWQVNKGIRVIYQKTNYISWNW